MTAVGLHPGGGAEGFQVFTAQNSSTLTSFIPTVLAGSWILRLLVNLAGYATVVVPGYLFILYVRRTGYLDRTGASCWGQIVRAYVVGSPPRGTPGIEEAGGRQGRSTATDKTPVTFVRQCLELTFCSVGLLVSYLIWGLLQERVMSYEYHVLPSKDDNTPSEKGERFGNSQFVVFTNRLLALAVAGAVLFVTGRARTHPPGGVFNPKEITPPSPPFYKYAYSSMSNILSSWCQYEALKYISFPVQVLSKASKVIPVMLMGRLVSRKSYSWSEYMTGLMISVGLFIFLLTSDVGGAKSSKVTTLSGAIILIGYLAFDSFTSNWQGELFRTYHISSFQMMFGVNLFSVILTSVSLIEQGAFIEAYSFGSRHPSFVMHIVVLSLTSAVGQLFIYRTIERFGPVTFTIIMTIRQAAAVLLSAIVYHHQMTVLSGLGVAIVFAAVFIRATEGRRGAKKNRKPDTSVEAGGGPKRTKPALVHKKSIST